MKSIDDILRKAKSEVPELSERFSTNVLLKIKEQELTILPQKIIRSQINWFSLIIGIGLLMIALMITNNAIFEIQMSGSLELLSFGTQYLSDFTKYLPLDIIIPSLFITAISAWLLVRSRMIKRGVTLVVAGSFLVTTIGGSALAATSLNGKIQASIIKEKTNIPIISWFYKERARYHMKHDRVQVGQVIEQNSQFVLIKDPYGKTQKIYLPIGMKVTPGQFIRMNGQVIENGFKAAIMQHCNPTSAGKYVMHMGMMMPNEMNGNMMEHHRHMKDSMMQNTGMMHMNKQ